MNRAAALAVLLGGCAAASPPPDPWEDVAAASGLRMSDDQETAFIRAVERLAAGRDARLPSRLELHLDRAMSRAKPLPERARAAAVRALGAYAPRESARAVLWAVLTDPAEAPPVRSAAFEALRPYEGTELAARVLSAPAPGDPWLAGLQSRLR